MAEVAHPVGITTQAACLGGLWDWHPFATQALLSGWAFVYVLALQVLYLLWEPSEMAVWMTQVVLSCIGRASGFALGPELSKVMACGPCFLLSLASVPLVFRVAEGDPCLHFLLAHGQDQGRLPP